MLAWDKPDEMNPQMASDAPAVVIHCMTPVK
jgi:hypothetical protein